MIIHNVSTNTKFFIQIVRVGFKFGVRTQPDPARPEFSDLKPEHPGARTKVKTRDPARSGRAGSVRAECFRAARTPLIHDEQNYLQSEYPLNHSITRSLDVKISDYKNLSGRAHSSSYAYTEAIKPFINTQNLPLEIRFFWVRYQRNLYFCVLSLDSKFMFTLNCSFMPKMVTPPFL